MQNLPSLTLQGKEVNIDDRLDFYPYMFNGDVLTAMDFEEAAFITAKRLSSDYDGGYWELIILDADHRVFYIYPALDKPVQVCTDGLNCQVSEQIFGIIVTLLALSSMPPQSQISKSLFLKLHQFIVDNADLNNDQDRLLLDYLKANAPLWGTIA